MIRSPKVIPLTRNEDSIDPAPISTDIPVPDSSAFAFPAIGRREFAWDQI